MATAQTIINRALRLIGAIEAGETPTSDESSDALEALNAMIESWQTERLFVYALVDTSFSMVAGDGSYTVGPSGNFNLTPRPLKLENIYVREGDIDYPVMLVQQDRWNAIADKTTQSNIPELAYYEPSLTTGTLQVWPIPSTGNSLHIVTWVTLASLASLATTITLPQGYERALAYNLAIEIAPEYQKAVSAEVQKIAMDSIANIKRANVRPMISYTELSLLVGGRKSNIEADQP